MSADHVTLAPSCPPSARPERLFDPASGVHALRAARARVSATGRVLDVFLYRDPPPVLADSALWRLAPPPGGTPVEIAAATIVAGHVELALAGLPDTARYRLDLDPPAALPFDPLRTWLGVRLRPECPDLGSCFAPSEPPAIAAPSPVSDYLARDWRALRAALLEELLRRDPQADLSIADPTLTLIELFAHVGDLLAYRQDRVATEAYLETARSRTSVRRHARLVDYAVADGAAARTVVHVAVPAATAATVSVQAGSVAVDAPGSDLAFTLEEPITADARLGEIPVYDWGEASCCLRAGATECVLVRPVAADPLGDGWLAPGDLLAFEVVDPDDDDRHAAWAGRLQAWPTDAAGTERFRPPLASRTAQVVRLTRVDPFADPLLGASLDLFRVRWAAQDALVRDYPVGVDTSRGGAEVTVARANLVPAHHGRRVYDPSGGTLARRLPDWADAATAPPAEFSMVAAGLPRSPRGPGPGLSLGPAGPYGLAVEVVLPSAITVPARHLVSLLDARPGELSFVIDTEEHEPPVLRFATGAVGLAPPLGSAVRAAYEVGGGVRGNVAANALTMLERNAAPPTAPPAWEVVPGVAVRNPAPATGGAGPQPLDEVRRDAPQAFAARDRRAVLPADHATAVLRAGHVQRAMAHRLWTGSWPLVATVVDLDVEGAAAADVSAGLQALLDDVRMLGTEAAVVAGTPVGLFVALEVCAGSSAQAEPLRRAILDVLRPGDDRRPGVFHPDRLQLGASVYLSTVVAAVAAVAGVDAVQVREARRLSDPPGAVHDVIAFAADEVGVLDDDPARPERGRLDVRVRGGR